MRFIFVRPGSIQLMGVMTQRNSAALEVRRVRVDLEVHMEFLTLRDSNACLVVTLTRNCSLRVSWPLMRYVRLALSLLLTQNTCLAFCPSPMMTDITLEPLRMTLSGV